MRRFLSLSWFHLKLFAKNGYFFWLMVGSTISVLLLQYLVAFAADALQTNQIWLRAGVFGLWSCATTAAGSIGFQRFQGTLPYLLNNAVDDRFSLAALLTPAASFGLLAFPLAWSVAWVLGVRSPIVPGRIMLGVVLLWLGAIILDLAIAALFVLTPNAVVYEELIGIPLLLLAGVFALPQPLQPILAAVRWVLPIAAPVHLLLDCGATLWLCVLQFCVSAGLCFVLSCALASRLLCSARKRGKMGVL